MVVITHTRKNLTKPHFLPYTKLEPNEFNALKERGIIEPENLTKPYLFDSKTLQNPTFKTLKLDKT